MDLLEWMIKHSEISIMLCIWIHVMIAEILVLGKEITMDKLKSRKFWICVAAFLASIATSIAGLSTSNDIVAAIGIVCGIISAAIYAFCEAWVDGKAVSIQKDEEECQ